MQKRKIISLIIQNVHEGPTTIGFVLGSDAMVAVSNPRCACTRAGGVNASHFWNGFLISEKNFTRNVKRWIEWKKLTLLRLISSKIASRASIQYTHAKKDVSRMTHASWRSRGSGEWYCLYFLHSDLENGSDIYKAFTDITPLTHGSRYVTWTDG